MGKTVYFSIIKTEKGIIEKSIAKINSRSEYLENKNNFAIFRSCEEETFQSLSSSLATRQIVFLTSAMRGYNDWLIRGDADDFARRK